MSRQRSAIEFQDIVAATFVVGKDLIEADFQTTQEAFDNLPQEGGCVFALQGNYTLSSAMTLPDKMVTLRGCGYASTIFTISAGLAISAFYDNFDQDRVFSDFRVQGDDTAGQIFYEAGPNNQFAGEGSIFQRVEAFNIERLFLNDPAGYLGITCREFGWTGSAVANPNSLTCDGSGSFIAYNSYFTDPAFSGLNGGFGKNGGGIGWGVHVTDCIVNISNGGFIPDGTSGLQAVTTQFLGDASVNAKLSITCSNGNRLAACQANGCYFEVSFLTQFSGCEFLGAMTRFIDVLAAGAIDVSGCYFVKQFLSEAIRIDGSNTSVVSGSFGCKITELSTSCANRYSGNEGMTGSTIIGLTSSVDGAVMADKASTTTNALVEIVPTITNPKGLIGIGTIKNTDGANTLSVTETFTDAFGTSSTLTTDVAPGNYLPLNLQQALGTGLAPYVSYKAEVIDKVAGNHATYVSHFTSQGSL